MSVAVGGKAIYGASLGILMLEARFPRIPGDMGNATTWPFPVLYKVVSGASPQRVVRERDGALVDAVRKLNPRRMMRNPVMFVVEAGSVLTTI